VTDIPFRVEAQPVPGDGPLAYDLPRAGRVRFTVRAGERRTGGHRVRLTRIVRDGSTVMLHCAIEGPPPDALVTQVLTTPAETVSVEERAVRGTRVAILVDASGTELARISA
jgi:hypothetical protein